MLCAQGLTLFVTSLPKMMMTIFVQQVFVTDGGLKTRALVQEMALLGLQPMIGGEFVTVTAWLQKFEVAAIRDEPGAGDYIRTSLINMVGEIIAEDADDDIRATAHS